MCPLPLRDEVDTLLITKCFTNRIPISIELPMYIAPVTLQIIAYTPESPEAGAFLATFRVLVESRLLNSLPRVLLFQRLYQALRAW